MSRGEFVVTSIVDNPGDRGAMSLHKRSKSSAGAMLVPARNHLAKAGGTMQREHQH